VEREPTDGNIAIYEYIVKKSLFFLFNTGGMNMSLYFTGDNSRGSDVLLPTIQLGLILIRIFIVVDI